MKKIIYFLIVTLALTNSVFSAGSSDGGSEDNNKISNYTKAHNLVKSAKKYEKISFQEVLNKGLNVMDMTAFTLSKENKLPIVVFDMNKPGNLFKIIKGDDVGTLVTQ